MSAKENFICLGPNDAETPATESLARVFKALSDPLRLELLRVLPKEADNRGFCVCDLAQRMRVSQPNLSHHLGILREAGLVRVKRCGGFSYYYVDTLVARGALTDLERTL